MNTTSIHLIGGDNLEKLSLDVRALCIFSRTFYVFSRCRNRPKKHPTNGSCSRRHHRIYGNGLYTKKETSRIRTSIIRMSLTKVLISFHIFQ